MLAMYATTGLVCAPLNQIQWIKELRLCPQAVSKTVNVATLLFQRGRHWLVDKCLLHAHFSSHKPSNAKFVALLLQFPSSMLLGSLCMGRFETWTATRKRTLRVQDRCHDAHAISISWGETVRIFSQVWEYEKFPFFAHSLMDLNTFSYEEGFLSLASMLGHHILNPL